jgi:hypothetical protein
MKNLLLSIFFASVALAYPADCGQEGDLVGQVVAGYQGWFGCGQDNFDPYHGWVHWGDGTNNSVTFDLWPDTREYTNTYQWDVNATLGNGLPATLYDSYDNQTVDTHFRWMKEHGIHAAALQRFGTNVAEANREPHLNGMAEQVAKYSEKHGVKWYIEWDCSGWTNFTTLLPQDWDQYVSQWTKTPSYAKQNGKPVVAVWGMGVSGRPGTPEDYAGVIEYLQSQGAYVLGGTEAPWRNLTDFYPTFQKLDALQPWKVGTFNNVSEAAQDYSLLQGDIEWCNENGVDYQACVWPGFSWVNLNHGPPNQIPREHGQFMWQQFYNLKLLNISTTYIAMFDEYDEGTAIAKAAEDSSMIPDTRYFLTLDADGVHVSSDFYLRVAKDGGEMLKGELPLLEQCPTPYTLPGDY